MMSQRGRNSEWAESLNDYSLSCEKIHGSNRSSCRFRLLNDGISVYRECSNNLIPNALMHYNLFVDFSGIESFTSNMTY